MNPIPFEKLTKRQIFRALLWLAWDRGEMTYSGRLSDLFRPLESGEWGQLEPS